MYSDPHHRLRFLSAAALLGLSVVGSGCNKGLNVEEVKIEVPTSDSSRESNARKEQPPPAPAKSEEWTADRISQSPSTYLTWCQQRTEVLESSLRARVIGIGALITRTERESRESASDTDELRSTLAEAKQAYRAAVASKKTEVVFRGFTLPLPDLELKLVELDERASNLKARSQALPQVAQKLRNELDDTKRALSEVGLLRDKISRALEEVKLREITGELSDIRRKVNEIADNSAQFEQTSVPSIDDLLGGKTARQTRRRVNDILSSE